MTPGQTRKEALRVLRATRREMLTSVWIRGLRSKDLATRRRAADALLNVQSAIDVIEQAELDAISAVVVTHEAAIKRSIEKLDGALQSLNRVTTVLNATEQLLALGARIAPLLIGVPV